MSDFSDAIKQFQGSVQEYQIGQAFRDASEQYKQLNSQAQDDFEKRRAYEQMGNQLGLQLAGLGASPLQIQAGMQSVMPKQFANADAMHKEALLTGSQKGIELANIQKKFENKDDLEKLSMRYNEAIRAQDAKQEYRASDAYMKELSKTQSEFNKYTKNSFDSINKLDTLERGIREGNLGIMASEATTLAKTIGNESGVLSDQDKADYRNFGSAVDKLQNAISKAVSGKGSPKHMRDVKIALQIARDAANQYKDKATRRFAGQFMRRVGHVKENLDLNTVMKDISGTYYDNQDQQQTTNQNGIKMVPGLYDSNQGSAGGGGFNLMDFEVK